MSNEEALNVVNEITALYAEREREAEKVKSIDRRIAELLGLKTDTERKPRNKTTSRADFARSCGIL